MSLRYFLPSRRLALGEGAILLLTYIRTQITRLRSLALGLHRSGSAALRNAARAVQNLGAWAVMAIAYDVIADVRPRAERGGMQGFKMGAANLAVCVGPVLKGLVAANKDVINPPPVTIN